jgi:CRISPR system Cascade subunit CasB
MSAVSPRTEQNELVTTISEIAGALRHLDPGPLAELRRMKPYRVEALAPYFWRLASRHGLRPHDRWALIVKMMAILTDKGDPAKRSSPHAARSKGNGWRGLGHALCDGGDPSWPDGATPRPMQAETRFARLVAAKGNVRDELLLRAIRALAAKKPPGVGVDCVGIARLVLWPGDAEATRYLAKDYYDRLDRAELRKDADDTASAGDDE